MDHRVRSGQSGYTYTSTIKGGKAKKGATKKDASALQWVPSPSACPPPRAQGTASTLTAFSFETTATITSAPLSKDDEALFRGIHHLAHVDLDTIDDCLLLSSITDDPSDEDTVHVASPELAPLSGRRPALLEPLSPPALLGLTPGDGLLDILDVIGAAHAWEDEITACQRHHRQTSCGTLTSFLDFDLDLGLDSIGDVVDAGFWSL